MNAEEISKYITTTFESVDMVVNAGDSFFFYQDPNLPPDHMFPFVTLVTSDVNDQFSNLNRPDVFRLNIGVGKQTFRSLFGTPKLPATEDGMTPSGDDDSDYDFTVLDQLMPHPVYGRMYWLCVLNPSDDTFATKVHPLLTEAYEMAVGKRSRRSAKSSK